MQNKVAIVLSTYNGEQYLQQQLDSILCQIYSNFDLFIHDDGSKDTTPSIIDKYVKKYPNVKPIVDKKGLGYPDCFIEMLRQIPEYDFYAFSDQDDVWNSDKLKNAIDCLVSLDNSLPNLYYTAVSYTDSNLNYIRSSRFAKDKSYVTKLSLQNLLFGGEALGMTFVFNNEAKKSLVIANDTDNYKDWFLKLYCASCGNVYYNPIPSAKYRRHSSAVTNNSNPSASLQRYLSQINEVFFDKDNFSRQKSILQYINTYCKADIIPANLDLFELFLSHNSFKIRLKKLSWKQRFRSKLIDEIGYRIAFLMGRI